MGGRPAPFGIDEEQLDEVLDHIIEDPQLDISGVEPSLAGPKRPQDRVALSGLKDSFAASLTAPTAERGFALDKSALSASSDYRENGSSAPEMTW